ncbi:EamA/RhaT family transporter [Streptomyces sp. JNUCC 64]
MSEHPPAAQGPRPAPLPFFGTSWVRRDRGYALRRAGVAVGSLAAAFAGCLLLRLAYEGLAAARVGALVNALFTGAFALCSALAFRRTWDGFGRAPEPADPSSGRGVLTLGFLGGLLAYFLRSFVEAPGEKRARAQYEAERARHERRTARRAGDPSKRRS